MVLARGVARAGRREAMMRWLTAKSGRLWYNADNNGSVFPRDGLHTIITIIGSRRTLLELPLHHSQQYIVRRDEIAQQGMRKWVVRSEVQLEQRIFSRCTPPERSVYGRLAAEGVDRFADGLRANVSGILYGVEVGSWEFMSRGTFLGFCRCGRLGWVV